MITESMDATSFLPPELEERIAGCDEVALHDARLRVPRVSAADVGAIASALAREGGDLGPRLTTATIIESIAASAANWLDPGFPERRMAEQLLSEITGYAPGMVAEGLDLLFRSLSLQALEDLVRSEKGHGRPPRLLFLVAAGTVFPPAIVGMTAALLLRSPVLVKPASTEPVLAALWARSLARRNPGLARLVAVLPWARTRTDLTAAALAVADCVLAHGDDDSIGAIRAAASPSTRIVAHGHRVSAAVIGGEAIAASALALARGLARDIALYDQEGCLSPHTVFVEETTAKTGAGFADLLGAELNLLARAWPRAPLTPGSVSSLRQFLLTAELEGRLVRGDLDCGWAVVCDANPRFEFSPLGRTVILKRVKSVDAAAEALIPVRNHLQAVGLAVPLSDRARLARRLGLYDDVASNPRWAPRVRLCPIGTMQNPPLDWPADGHRPLASLCLEELP